MLFSEDLSFHLPLFVLHNGKENFAYDTNMQVLIFLVKGLEINTIICLMWTKLNSWMRSMPKHDKKKRYVWILRWNDHFRVSVKSYQEQYAF